MRNILTLIFILASLAINAQIVGKTTVLKINGDPNLVLGLEDQTGYYESTLAQDTLTGLWYDWQAGRTPVWQETHTAGRTKATPFGLITGTDVETQIQQVQSLIPGIPVSGSNVLFVSKGTGNNATAKVGTNIFPFADPWAARDTAIVQGIISPVIVIQDGSFSYSSSIPSATKYTSSIHDVSLARNNYTYLCSEAVTISSIGAQINAGFGVFTDSVGVTWQFLGNAKLVQTSSVGGVGTFQNANTRFTLKASSLNTTSGAGVPPFQFLGNSVVGLGTKVGKGTGTISINIQEIVCSNNSRMFGVYGLATDTVFVNAQLNFGKAVMNGANMIVSFSPIYVEGNIDLRFEDFSYTNTPGFNYLLFFDSARAGFLNSTFSIDIERLNLVNAANINNRIEVGTASVDRKPSFNHTRKFKVGQMTGSLLVFQSATGYHASNSMLWDFEINGRNTTSVDFLDIPSALPTGVNFKCKLDMEMTNAAADIFDIDDTDCELLLLNSYIKTPAQAFDASVIPTRVDIVNSYIDEAVTSTLTNNNFYGASSVFRNSSPSAIYAPLLGEPIWRSNTFTATASQSTFTTTPAKLPITSANLVVIKNGLEQTDTVNYTYVPSTGVITFIPALAGGEVMKIRWFD